MTEDLTLSRLPNGFQDLDQFIDHWAGRTTQQRLEARSLVEMPAIRAFYDAMVPRAEEALAYLEAYDMHNLPPEAENLLALVLALAQAHIAVEIHGAARAPNTPWPNSIRIESGLPLLG